MSEYKIGDIIKCEITGISSFGIFVKTEFDYNGLVHISEISNKYVSNIEKRYLVNDIIEAKIIDINEEKKQLSLSIKQISQKKQKRIIEEKGDGFIPLKKNLNIWVEEKLKELKNNEKSV